MVMDIHDKMAINNATIIAMMYRLAVESGTATPDRLLELANQIAAGQTQDSGGDIAIVAMAKLWASGKGPTFTVIDGGKA